MKEGVIRDENKDGNETIGGIEVRREWKRVGIRKGRRTGSNKGQEVGPDTERYEGEV